MGDSRFASYKLKLNCPNDLVIKVLGFGIQDQGNKIDLVKSDMSPMFLFSL